SLDSAHVPDFQPEARQCVAHRRFRHSDGHVQTLSGRSPRQGGRSEDEEESEIGSQEETPRTKDQTANSGADGKNSQMLGALPHRGLLVFVAEPRHQDHVVNMDPGALRIRRRLGAYHQTLSIIPANSRARRGNSEISMNSWTACAPS